MEVVSRRKISDLIQEFVSNAADYHFFQAIYLLETHFGEDPHSLEHRGSWQYFHLIPSATLSFPAADIKNCEIDANQRILIRLNFMGLYGVDSPLPHYFLTQTVQDEDKSVRLRAFLDILNHRLYCLLYLAWKRFHIHVQADKENAAYWHYLKALSGNTLTYTDCDEFAFAGLFGARIHNISSITAMVSEYLGNVAVKVQPFAARWVKLGTLNLGQNYKIQLGNNAVLGDRVVDLSSKIIIFIGPLTTERATNLLPGQEENQRLCNLLSRYLGPTLTFEIKLIIEYDGSSIVLGKQPIPLGWASWLGKFANKTYCIPITKTG